MKPQFFPSCLAEETELLEALDWDEEALHEVIEQCQSAFEDVTTEFETKAAMNCLYATLTEQRGEQIAKFTISLFLKRVFQHSNEEIES